jgi:HSP20 family molecular chaperone IbpA
MSNTVLSDFFNQHIPGDSTGIIDDFSPWFGIFPKYQWYVPTTSSTTFSTPWDSVKSHVNNSEKEWKLEVLIPGADKNNISVELIDSVLKISYERKEEENGHFSQESFKQEVIIDTEIINTDTIASKYENGILVISAKKYEKTEIIPNTKKIAIE